MSALSDVVAELNDLFKDRSALELSRDEIRELVKRQAQMREQIDLLRDGLQLIAENPPTMASEPEEHFYVDIAKATLKAEGKHHLDRFRNVTPYDYYKRRREL